MKLQGIPESIPREKVVDFFTSLGIAPSRCVSIQLDYTGIHAEVFALNEDGKKIPTRDGVATHNVFIKFD